jgi:hypothetical protein
VVEGPGPAPEAGGALQDLHLLAVGAGHGVDLSVDDSIGIFKSEHGSTPRTSRSESSAERLLVLVYKISDGGAWGIGPLPPPSYAFIYSLRTTVA